MQENTINDNQTGNEDVSQPWGMINEQETKEYKEPEREDNHHWSRQLKYWIAISLIPTAVCAIIAFFYFSFIFLALIFPLIAGATWYIREIFIRYDLDKENWLK